MRRTIPAGARALASYLARRDRRGVTLVFGAMRDKAVGEMLARWRRGARSIDLHHRADAARAAGRGLARLARPSVDARASRSIDGSARGARARAATAARTVVVAGSIFLDRARPRAAGPWYSAVIPSRLRIRRQSCCVQVSSFLSCWRRSAWPRRAHRSHPGGCKVWQTDAEQTFSMTTEREHYARLIRRRRRSNCNDMQFFADEVEIFSDADRMRASGNVVFVSSDNRISAERMEFNTQDAHRDVLHRLRHRQPRRTAASIAACSARRSPTPTSGVRRSRSSGPRRIASPTAGSRPACSRRRAGSWSPAPSR